MTTLVKDKNTIIKEMPYDVYVSALSAKANEPLCLSTIMLPFGIRMAKQRAYDLLVGHHLDYLEQITGRGEVLDPIDVCVAALELGHVDAGAFIDEIPEIVSRASKSPVLYV